MEILVVTNGVGKTKKVTAAGREYLVAPLFLIVPGVLNGSKGALYYPGDEIAKNIGAWNGMPLTNGHPTMRGMHVTHDGLTSWRHTGSGTCTLPTTMVGSSLKVGSTSNTRSGWNPASTRS